MRYTYIEYISICDCVFIIINRIKKNKYKYSNVDRLT